MFIQETDRWICEMFEQMKKDGIISTRGLKEDAFLYGELVFDVNTVLFS